MTGYRHHRHHGERFDRRRKRRSLPHVAIGVGIYDVLQRLAKLAKSIHPFVHALTAEHSDAQFQSALVKLLVILDRFPSLIPRLICREHAGLSSMRRPAFIAPTCPLT